MIKLNITKATPKDVDWLNDVIKREFPYTTFDPEKIIERMNNPKYVILIAKQANILVGFAELELFLDKKEARMNAVFVEDSWRGQRIGTTLVGKCINECKHKKVQRLFLLVKKDNKGAKHLYKDEGFNFVEMHDKIIDESEVEMWEIKV